MGITALSHAASNGSPLAVAALLRAGASVDLVQHSGASPLTCACIGLDDDSLSAPPAAGCLECIRLLLQRRADPDIQNTEPEEAGATALMYASQAGATKAVQLLLACGARTDLTSSQHATECRRFPSQNGQGRTRWSRCSRRRSEEKRKR